jgi:hypothetical protein
MYERINAMSEARYECGQFEDQIFFEKLSDDAIERAAEPWRTGAYTVGNCTGLESCPA